MNNDNNKKITWTRNAAADVDNATQSPVSTDTSVNNIPIDIPKGVDAQIPVMEVSARAASYGSGQISNNPESEISSLKDEIDKALGDSSISSQSKDKIAISSKQDQSVNLDNSMQEGLSKNENIKPIDPLMNPINEPQESGLDQMQQNHETLVASLQKDIQSDFTQEYGQPETAKPDVSPKTGIEHTYYSDLSNAMGSNEPATMSELIRRSRFEEKESKILSPKSKKNIAFMIGAVLLLITSILIISSLFINKDNIVFVAKTQVSSLVRANLDTGINTTGLESARIKQAIRDVIETKIPEDTINQIYYVENDGLGNLRRLGVKNIFEKTDNETPILLYDNIENDFTHGVYKTDKNYPFILMKTLSYDRAFQGMLEWEPTMLDDLATYMDLPPEATDRSLLKDGFEDDLIRNKTVRVVRFLPREVDRRGILDFLKGNTNEESVENENQIEELTIIDRMIRFVLDSPRAYAQDQTGQGDGDLNWNLEGDSEGTIRVCYNDDYPGEIFPESFEGQAGYYCVDTIEQGGGIGQISEEDTIPICFNPATGNRVEGDVNSSLFCFEAYQCYRYSCFIGNTDIGPNGQGQPGAICREVREEGPKYHENDPRYNSQTDAGQKICREFTGLRSVQNINSALLCFDQTGQYLPSQTSENPDLGVICITPQSRQSSICVDRNNQIVNPTAPVEKMCFEPLSNRLSIIAQEEGTTVNNQCSDLTVTEIQQQLAAAAFELRFLAGLANLFGLSDGDTQNMVEAAQFLEDIAYQNILQIEVIRQGALVVQRMELILNVIDPNLELPLIGPNGGLNLYGYLRGIIDIVKCTLGIANTLQWSTLAQIPQGITIYAGQTLPEMEQIQQALVLIGLLDPLSMSGTLDLVTQDVISQFQLANALEITGILDPPTLALIAAIIEAMDPLSGGSYVDADGNPVDANGNPISGEPSIYGDDAIINDYFVISNGAVLSDGQIIVNGVVYPIDQILTMGAYNDAVESLQVLLYAEGYDISHITGLFNEETCLALQEYQDDEDLEIADPVSCTVSAETMQNLNELIREKGYLGSGFFLNPQGFLQGTGELDGSFGPGVVDFNVNSADADTLNEGDIVLMYMFLDEKTLLIAKDEIVIDEIIKRRALDDIFQ